MVSRLLGAALLFVPLFAACSCDEDPLAPVTPGSVIDAGFIADAAPLPDASAPDAGPEPDAGPPDSGVPEARVLTFDGTSPVTVYFGAGQDLRFVLRTASGVAVPSETVRFSATGSAGTFGPASALTDASGAVVVRFTAGASAGQSVLTAEADRAPSVQVIVEVREDPSAELQLDVRSSARITVTAAEASIYIGAAGSVPTCAQLFAAAPPAPVLAAAYAMVPGSRTFTGLQSGSMVTAYATGTNSRGDVVARGCVEGTRLAGGMVTRIDLELLQLPTDPSGDYDALLQVDLGAGLPPPYGPVIVTVTDILSDPAGWAVYQTLAELDRQLGTSFVTWTPPGGGASRIATFVEVRSNANVFNTWRIASNALDNFLVSQLGQAYIDVTNVGGDLAHAIRSFEIGAGYSITSTGAVDRVEVVEEWKALVFQWQLGCPNGDLGCARRPVQLSGANAHLAPAQARYGATITHAPLAGETERFQLSLDAHQLNLRYGAVILLVLNQLVFPSLPANIAGNDLTQVLGNIVACGDVANSLASSTGLPASLFLGLCNSAVSAAASAVEARLLALDSANNPGFLGGAGVNGGGELYLTDADHDLRTELVPSVLTYAAWQTAGGSQPINAPITGHGRRAASACTGDGDCNGNICLPIPSYLEVRLVEHDCRRPIGATAGAVGCAQDADCASGLCFDPGNGVRICHAACSDSSDCALGSCAAGVAALDLDPVLAGLGQQPISACVP